MRLDFPLVAYLVLSVFGGACVALVTHALGYGGLLAAIAYSLGGVATFALSTACALMRPDLAAEPK